MPTKDVRPGLRQMVKAAELIHTSRENLTKNEQLVWNKLLANAHKRAPNDEGQWEIPKKELLLGGHASTDRILPTLEALVNTRITVSIERNGRSTKEVMTMLAWARVPDDRQGVVQYRFVPELLQVLDLSNHWGLLRWDIMNAMASKYALALYELGQQRVNLNFKWSEDISLGKFRELLGVEAGKLKRYDLFNRKAIRPAVQQVNALAEFHVDVEPLKTGRAVTDIRLKWYKKEGDELRAAYEELRRHSAGRKARISGTVEDVQVALPKASQ